MDKKILSYLPYGFIEESVDSNESYDDITEEDIDYIQSLIEEAVTRTISKLTIKKKLALRKKREVAKKKGLALTAYERLRRRKAKRYLKRNRAKVARMKLKYSRTAAGKRAKLITQRREERRPKKWYLI